ncbi:5-formyltetrahydrofolate cyclo-ligase [Myxococcota bacterium]|nr:5-formyltetrahydrofolate cyclo-ligase [Myxococcota bacterium]
MIGDKRALRRAMSSRRRMLSVERSEAAGRAVADLFLGESPLCGAERVALYVATSGELPTRPLFDLLRQRGVACSFPRSRADGGLEFFEVEDWDTLVPGRYGVSEPPPGAPRMLPIPGDVVVVPGLAFDHEGHRLGRGMGYYDRAFVEGPGGSPLLVGAAHGFQLVESVPHETHDRNMDAVVTEQGVSWTKERNS